MSTYLVYQARPSLSLQKFIRVASLICNPTTAPVLILHTEAKVLLMSQNGKI